MQEMYEKVVEPTNYLQDVKKKTQNLLCTCTARNILRCTLLWWSGLHLELPQVFINTEFSWITGHVGSDNICFYTHLLWGNLNWQNSYCTSEWGVTDLHREEREFTHWHTSARDSTPHLCGTLNLWPDRTTCFVHLQHKKKGKKKKRSMHWCSAEPCSWRQITAMLLQHTQKHLFNDTSVMWLGERPSPRPFKVKGNYWLFK